MASLEEYAARCLKEHPAYDKCAYQANKRQELQRIFDAGANVGARTLKR